MIDWFVLSKALLIVYFIVGLIVFVATVIKNFNNIKDLYNYFTYHKFWSKVILVIVILISLAWHVILWPLSLKELFSEETQ